MCVVIVKAVDDFHAQISNVAATLLDEFRSVFNCFRLFGTRRTTSCSYTAIIVIVFIYHTGTKHKIRKLNSVNNSMEGYQRSYSS